jgi:hypothetical protein
MDQGQLHLKLTLFAQRRLRPALPDAPRDDDDLPLRALEAGFLEDERAAIADLAAEAPKDPGEFAAWFEELKLAGPGQGDPLFPWLAEHATREQLSWFLMQEIAGETGVDDLVAFTQVRMPTHVKLALARNYWDEMGRGREPAMHGPLLLSLARAAGVEPDPARTVWESLALGNLMLAMALDRRWAFHSVGALGAVELTATSRVAFVDKGLARMGLPRTARRYLTTYAAVHGRTWSHEVLATLAAEGPRVAQAIAEGALMRLAAGARCYDRYRRELWRLQSADRVERPVLPIVEPIPMPNIG